MRGSASGSSTGSSGTEAPALDEFSLTALVLAERFGADNGRIARIILWSTALAFVSFSLAVRLCGAKAVA